ncbi:unnamed protein product [Ectocarpus sp. 12 AP-2014]
METQMESVGGGGGDADRWRRGRSGSGAGDGEAFRFRCTEVVESRHHDEVGPYVTKRARDYGTLVEWSDWTFAFSLLHTPLEEFLGEARRLREVALRVKERGHGYEEPLLRPLLAERLRGSTEKFDTIHLVDFRETLLLPCPVRVDRITPLLRNPGCIMVTDARVYFQPAELNNVGEPVASFPLAGVLRAFKRRHMLRQTGLEIFMEADGGSAFFNFESPHQRDELFDVLMSQPQVGPRAQSARDIEAETRRWQSGQVSNYDYLVFLNTVAGRTVNDITQYPVFPWVVQDFESATLNLDDDRVYRDLSRPIGALNDERLEYFRTRMSNMPDPELHPGQGIPPPFLYGTHYSTPGYALFFLVRSAPEEMLCLQNGRFDDPDRSFISVKSAWDSVLNNHADLKELIPEFYAGDGSFLTNADDLQLGVTQVGQRVGDVELPPWARNPRDFVRKMRRALESPHVSRRLHLWIDLVFGYLQRGKAAIEADNLFYHLTYEGTVDLETIDDPRERAALESQISEFGQCPSLLFAGPHPRRDDAKGRVTLASSVRNAPAATAAPAAVAADGGIVESRREVTPDPADGGARNQSPLPEKHRASFPAPPSDFFASSNNSDGLHAADRRAPPQQPQWSAGGGGLLSSYSQGSPAAAAAAASSALAVGNSVGALWKRGWAMAGAVSEAAAEATGVRATTLQQRWPAAPAEGRARERSVEFSAGLREDYGNDDGGRLERSRSNPSQPSQPHGHEDAIRRSLTVTVEPAAVAGGTVSSSLNRGTAGNNNDKYPPTTSGGASLRDPQGVGALATDVPGFPSTSMGGRGFGRDGETMASEAREEERHRQGGGGGGRGPTALNGMPSLLRVPSALAAVTGGRRWRLDPSKVELRPGEPMVLHRDGVTCAHVVRTNGVGHGGDPPQQHQPGASAAAGATGGMVAVSAAGEERGSLTLCASSKDGSLKIFALKREAGGSGPVSKAHTRRRVAGGEMAMSCCALTSDGKHAVAGSWNNSILVYSVEAACVLSRVEGAHEDGVSCLALHEEPPLTSAGSGGSSGGGSSSGGRRSPDPRRKLVLATGSWDAAVKVWEIGSVEMDPVPVLELFDLETPAQALCIDGAGKALAAGGEDGMVAVWDIATGALSATFSGCADQSPIVSIRWAETGDGAHSIPGGGMACLVLASAVGEIWRVSPVGVPLGSLRLDSEVVAMDSDGRCTVVACRDGSLRLLGSLEDGGFTQTVVRESGHAGDITCLHVCAWDSGGNANNGAGNAAVIVTGSDGGAVRVWDVMHRYRV